MNLAFSFLVLFAVYISISYAFDEDELYFRIKDLQDTMSELSGYSSPLIQNEKIRDLITAYESDNFPFKRNLQSITPRSGLSPDCNNKLCDTIFYELTCKAEGIHMTKTCAEYLVGNIFSCSDYPSPDDFYDAPSICANEIAQAIVPIISNPNPVSSLTTFLYDDFGNKTCGRNCWQNFQRASLSLYGDKTCLAELNTYNTTYKFMSGMATFQPFRNQACSNVGGKINCFASITSLMNGGAASPDLNVLTPTCEYFPQGDVYDPEIEALNSLVKSTLCQKFSQFQCCAATSLDLIYGNQVNSTDLKIFPPCLLSYFENQCPTLSLTNYCVNGSMASQTFTRLKFSIVKAEAGQLFPAVYNTNSLLYFNAALSTLFTKFNFGVQPYNFNPNYPFQVKIYDFMYYNNGVPLTPTNGSMFYPAGGDYALSTSGDFEVQIYLQNLTPTEAKTFELAITSAQFIQGVKQVFGASATTEVVTIPTLLEPVPLVIVKNFSIKNANISTIFLAGFIIISSFILNFLY